MASVKGFDGTLTEYEQAFSQALRSSAKQGRYKIAGMPALVDYGSVLPISDRNGTIVYSTTLRSADSVAEVPFTPIGHIDAGKATIVFEPSSATVKEWKKP